MGTFLGHAVPGTFFLGFSLWWAYCIFYRYFMYQKELAQGGFGSQGSLARKNSPLKYKNVPSFACKFFSTSIPIEGFIKVLFVTAGMIGECITGFEDGHFAALGNAQHMTMYFFFGLNGVMDILQHYRFPLPPDIDYTSGILALCMEALLFYYHIHGRAQLNVLVHMLLFYVIIGCSVSTVSEMKYRDNVLPALCKVYFVMLQGTWFWQVAFILYPPNGNKWDDHNHEQMMIVTMLFTWHNAAIFVFLLIMGIVIYHRIKNIKILDHTYQYLADKRGKEKSDKRKMLNDHEFKDILDTEDDDNI